MYGSDLCKSSTSLSPLCWQSIVQTLIWELESLNGFLKDSACRQWFLSVFQSYLIELSKRLKTCALRSLSIIRRIFIDLSWLLSSICKTKYSAYFAEAATYIPLTQMRVWASSVWSSCRRALRHPCVPICSKRIVYHMTFDHRQDVCMKHVLMSASLSEDFWFEYHISSIVHDIYVSA